jgi:DNA-binding MarR family transcriptional regulator
VPDGVDDLLLNPARLAIVALLSATEWAEFATVRDGAELTDSTLSKQMNILGDEGYIEIRKGYVGRRPRTWLNITRAGRAALTRHIEALQTIARNAAGS